MSAHASHARRVENAGKGSNQDSWARQRSAATRRQLVLAAMRLMAKHGIDGVSLRSVNVAASSRNASAAHYHFGSKEGLVEAVVDALAEEVARIRDPLLARLEERRRGSTPPSPREIVEAGYLPFLGLFYQAEYGLAGIRFLSRLIVGTAPGMRVLANRFTAPLAHDVFELLAEALPQVPPRLLKARILFSLINLINGSSDAFSLSVSPFGDMSYENPIELANDFLDYIVAGLSAPPSVATESFVASCEGIIRTYRSAPLAGPRKGRKGQGTPGRTRGGP